MKIDIYKDGISYVTNEMSSIHPSEANLSEFTRAKFVTDLAAVSRGKDGAKNPKKRYKALLTEAAPQLDKDTYQSMVDYANDELVFKGSPSRPLEFLPIVFDIEIYKNEVTLWDEYGNDIILPRDNHSMSFVEFLSLAQHSHIEENFSSGNETVYRCYTNMRACINAGIPYEAIPYNTVEELKDFRAFKANVPMFVFNHLITHTALSKEAQSDRVTKNGQYWLPQDFRKRVYVYVNENDGQVSSESEDICKSILSKIYREDIVSYLLSLSQNLVQHFLKDIGYKKEIYQRAMLEFRYKEVVFTGWNNDPKVWEHLFIERNAKPNIWNNWTQNETKQFVQYIKEVI